MSFQKYLVDVAKLAILSTAVAAPVVAMMHYSFKKLSEIPVRVSKD